MTNVGRRNGASRRTLRFLGSIVRRNISNLLTIVVFLRGMRVTPSKVTSPHVLVRMVVPEGMKVISGKVLGGVSNAVSVSGNGGRGLYPVIRTGKTSDVHITSPITSGGGDGVRHGGRCVN